MFNTRPQPNLKRIKNSCLLQDDIFLPGSTVWETLKYQAELRLLPQRTKEERQQLISSLLDTLEILNLKDTRVIGYTAKISLSGGEQRRVSIASQLLSRPKILFLDESTSGLLHYP